MHRLARALLLLPLLTACGRCGRGPASGEGPPALATVNGEPVTVESLRRELQADRAGAPGPGPEPLPAALRRQVLDDAVDRLLLLQAARERQVSVAPEQVEQALLRLRAEYPGSHFDDLLAQEKIAATELKARLREQLTIERLVADEVYARVQVADDEVQRFYQEHGSDFDEPEQVRARQVVVRTREEAARVREELRRKPQAFADVARRASIAPEGKAGGDLGFFGRGSGMPEVFDVCFKLPQNQLSEVVPSPYGFHLFQVTERRPAARRALAEARAGIREKLLREKRARAQEEYLQALRQKARITIDQRAIDALAP